MRRFLVLWAGQLASVFGSGLSGFALGVWIFQRTESVTQFTVVYMCTTLPGVLISPLAGTLVDRWRRRTVMILADVVAGLGTLGLLLVFAAGRLDLAWILVATVVSSTATAFQVPAQQAAVALLVPARHLPRAAGMLNLATSLSQVLAPLAAGVLLENVGLGVILGLDVASFLFAVGTLLVLRIPELAKTSETESSLRRELRLAWRYLRSLEPLFLLLRFEILLRFRVGVVHILMTPLVLSFADAETLGTVLSLGGIGMILGSLLTVGWGGPRRRIHGVFLFQALGGVFLLVACVKPWVWLVGAGIFAYFFCLPIAGACSQAIWQTKVAPAFQGRVFALRRMIGWSGLPLAYLVAGPLSDRVFEPWMAEGGLLASSVGSVLGVGPGRGVALLFGAMGLFAILLMTLGFLYRPLRYIEDELPDQVGSGDDSATEEPAGPLDEVVPGAHGATVAGAPVSPRPGRAPRFSDT